MRTGYLTSDGRYLRLVQSDADEAALLATEAEGAPVASGPVVVSGTTWVSYTDDTREPIRIAALDGVRLLITGSGDRRRVPHAGGRGDGRRGPAPLRGSPDSGGVLRVDEDDVGDRQ